LPISKNYELDARHDDERRGSAVVVYTTDDGAFGTLAEEIAADRGESLVRDLEPALESDEPVVYVEAPANVEERRLLPLQERLTERGPANGAFGVVTGYTADEAADLYFPRSETDAEAVEGTEHALLPRTPPTELPHPPNATVLADQEITARAIEDLTSERLESFQIASSGRPIHVFLSDGLICGIPNSYDVDDFEGIDPFCVEDGDFDCPMDGDLVHAQSIDADHFFLMSCSSTIDNGTAGLPVNVGLGLLDGADSLIGTYRVGFNQPPELLFHHALLSAGYDVSERCYLLNRSARANGIMLNPYVAFGRPDASVADPDDPQFEVEIASAPNGDATGSDEGGDADETALGDDLRVRLTDVGGYVADFRIPEERVPDYDTAEGDRLYVRNHSDTEDRVYYAAFEEDGDARILVYTGSRMSIDELELEVSPHPARYVERRTAVASATNVRRTAAMGFLSSDADERMRQLDTQIRKLPVKVEDENFDADHHAELEQDFSILHGQVDAIREELLGTIRDRSDFVHFEYAPNAAADDVYRHLHDCRICGERPVFTKQITGWADDTKRLLSSCPRCSFVFDVPVSDQTVEPSYPKVDCELDADGPRHRPVTIEFTNPSDDPMQATFQPIVLHRDNEANDFFEPRERAALLLPGETHAAEFTIDTALLPHDMYFVMGVVVGNLDVYAGYDVALKGEQGEYYPRHLR
jgi:hypothetical protein